MYSVYETKVIPYITMLVEARDTRDMPRLHVFVIKQLKHWHLLCPNRKRRTRDADNRYQNHLRWSIFIQSRLTKERLSSWPDFLRKRLQVTCSYFASRRQIYKAMGCKSAHWSETWSRCAYLSCDSTGTSFWPCIYIIKRESQNPP